MIRIPGDPIQRTGVIGIEGANYTVSSDARFSGCIENVTRSVWTRDFGRIISVINIRTNIWHLSSSRTSHQAARRVHAATIVVKEGDVRASIKGVALFFAIF
jgi:hypothetical protein